MKLTPEQEQKVRHQFTCFCKTVLRNEARDYQRQIIRRSQIEAPLSALSEKADNQEIFFDVYPSDYSFFNVQGYTISVKDDRLAAALQNLSLEKREIVLLAYFLGLNDREIADKLNIVKRTVQYKRVTSLKEMREFIVDNAK